MILKAISILDSVSVLSANIKKNDRTTNTTAEATRQPY
jgi:hypothetical protein